jgi:NADPH:quinone reductase-like Zn-dependent oxidoreductase
MRAIQIAQFGNPSDVVRVVDLPDPPAPRTGTVPASR